MEKLNFRKTRGVYLVLTILMLLEMPNIVDGSISFYMTIQATTTVSSPPVTLENVTNSFVYTNKTSAKVTVSNKTTDLDVLKILNQTNDDWQLQLIKFDDNNITRLTNCTICFHNGNTTIAQIKIINGQYNQTSGNYYNLVGSGADHITITALTNITGTSYICTHLKILEPNTSTYSFYVITFEIT